MTQWLCCQDSSVCDRVTKRGSYLSTKPGQLQCAGQRLGGDQGDDRWRVPAWAGGARALEFQSYLPEALARPLEHFIDAVVRGAAVNAPSRCAACRERCA